MGAVASVAALIASAVAAGAQATVSFAVVCAAAQGGLQVTVATTGDAPDPDGYVVSLDGGAGQPVGVNGTTSFAGVSAGAHSVTLGGLSAACAVDGTNPRAVDVGAAGTATVSFAVVCSSAAGSLQVAVSTTGASWAAGAGLRARGHRRPAHRSSPEARRAGQNRRGFRQPSPRGPDHPPCGWECCFPSQFPKHRRKPGRAAPHPDRPGAGTALRQSKSR